MFVFFGFLWLTLASAEVRFIPLSKNHTLVLSNAGDQVTLECSLQPSLAWKVNGNWSFVCKYPNCLSNTTDMNEATNYLDPELYKVNSDFSLTIKKMASSTIGQYVCAEENGKLEFLYTIIILYNKKCQATPSLNSPLFFNSSLELVCGYEIETKTLDGYGNFTTKLLFEDLNLKIMSEKPIPYQKLDLVVDKVGYFNKRIVCQLVFENKVLESCSIGTLRLATTTTSTSTSTSTSTTSTSTSTSTISTSTAPPPASTTLKSTILASSSTVTEERTTLISENNTKTYQDFDAKINFPVEGVLGVTFGLVFLLVMLCLIICAIMYRRRGTCCTRKYGRSSYSISRYNNPEVSLIRRYSDSMNNSSLLVDINEENRSSSSPDLKN